MKTIRLITVVGSLLIPVFSMNATMAADTSSSKPTLMKKLFSTDPVIEIGHGQQRLKNKEGFDIDHGANPYVLSLGYSFNNPICCKGRYNFRNRISVDVYNKDVFDTGEKGFYGLEVKSGIAELSLYRSIPMQNDFSWGFGVGLGIGYTRAKTFLDNQTFLGTQLRLSAMLQSGPATVELLWRERSTEKAMLDDRETRIDTRFVGITIGFGSHYLR